MDRQETENPGKRSFRPIGSLIPGNGSMPSSTGANPTPPDETSSSSTDHTGGQWLTGTSPGNGGVVPNETKTALREAMRTGQPKAVDKFVVGSLVPSLRSNAHTAESSMTNEADGQFEGVVVDRIDFRPGRPVEDVRQALALLELACTPARPERLAAALGELALATKTRKEGDDDTTARIGMFVRELEAFPADVALATCRRRAQGYQFFPSLSELLMTARLLGSKRLALRDGLRRALAEATP